jgi:hypothetical protein
LGKVFVICQSCDCHVRAAERMCPHCGADVLTSGGTRSPRQRSVEVRRVLLCTALGIGAAACGGQVNTTQNLPAEATQEDVEGACLADGSFGYGMCGTWAGACTCGPAGECDMGQCTWKQCDPATEYLDGAGDCVLNPSCPPNETNEGNKCVPYTHTCYGGPPLLG